jgi:hypothetical protein
MSGTRTNNAVRLIEFSSLLIHSLAARPGRIPESIPKRSGRLGSVFDQATRGTGQTAGEIVHTFRDEESQPIATKKPENQGCA